MPLRSIKSLLDQEFLNENILFLVLQAEPSPTTGSFLKPQMVYGSLSSTTYSATTMCSDFDTFDERNSGSFEFKPHAGSNMVISLSIVGLLSFY